MTEMIVEASFHPFYKVVCRFQCTGFLPQIPINLNYISAINYNVNFLGSRYVIQMKIIAFPNVRRRTFLVPKVTDCVDTRPQG